MTGEGIEHLLKKLSIKVNHRIIENFKNTLSNFHQAIIELTGW